ncbi:MAG: hypothetical protein HUU20_25535 [Pirellulales bacterium]|nr:hypothetical protein [Pirellulales bacterium]
MHVAEREQKSPAGTHRSLQYGLRTLLLLTCAAAIAFSWIGYEVRLTAYREALLEEQFGRPWPEASWIGKCLVALEFNSISKPRMLEHLKDFPDLRKLVIWFNGELRDDQLAHVGGLPQLVELDLRGTQITDKGIAKLRSMISTHTA